MDYTQCARQLLQLLVQNMHSAGTHSRLLFEILQGEAAVLYLLYHRGCGMTPSQISTALDRSPSRIANTLNALEEKGQIRRSRDDSDRRKVLVSITPEGTACLREKKEQLLTHFAAILTRLGEHDAAEYVRLTQEITQYILEQPAPEVSGDHTRAG